MMHTQTLPVKTIPSGFSEAEDLVRRPLPLIAAIFLFACSSTFGDVVVDGYKFSAISNNSGGGQISLTGGDSLAVRGSQGTAEPDTQSVYHQFEPVELEVGDSLKLEFTLLNLETIDSAAGLRIALGNMPAAEGDVGSPNPDWVVGPREGYALWIPTSGKNSQGRGNVLFRKFTGSQNPLGGSGSQNVELAASAANFAAANGYQSTTVVLEIKRSSAETVELSGMVGPEPLIVVQDSSAALFSFNTMQIGLRAYNDNRGFEVERIRIDVVRASSDGAASLR